MNLIEVTSKFPDELSATKHFEQARWGDTPTCAYCGSEKLSRRKKDHRFTCLKCNKSFSVTVNTMLHKTRIPLRRWLIAFSLVTDAKKGVPAKQLQRNLGVSYKTAWRMGMKMRKLMYDPAQKLDDVVEMDETYVGGKPRKGGYPNFTKKDKAYYDRAITQLEAEDFDISEGKRKKPWVPKGMGHKTIADRKTPVVGMVERDGNVIAKVMKTISAKKLKAMVEKNIDEEDSVLITDNHKGYNKMNRIIDHIKVDHQKMYSYRGINTNTIESFWAIIKRGIMGQYHKVSVKYLPDYIAEFVFKYNNRNKDDMFETLVTNAMKQKQN
ncbi:IS1595 family transposase [Gracilimonas mengyeensis]|uniref:Transposase zinc-ribbon domain-containing protein n=1 Tax=Gracilimonas mengyeensis TaxID=1302730 RepID=A0A521DEG3_9BACT|nr:IS1595 family transposase [Gracilimonas mengyeensis]SMO70033.1 Transposase zinc-ribbon domain-containing protein [Gracilimonas mengyeensis]